MSDIYTVEALTPEGELKYRWQARLVSKEENLVVLHGDWDRELEHADGTTTPVTNQSLEFYWADEEFFVSALYDEAVKLREYYCRVITQPEIDEDSKLIRFELLGSDLQVQPDLSYEIIDASEEDSGPVSDGWLNLIVLIERREGPFDRQTLSNFTQLAGLTT